MSSDHEPNPTKQALSNNAQKHGCATINIDPYNPGSAIHGRQALCGIDGSTSNANLHLESMHSMASWGIDPITYTTPTESSKHIIWSAPIRAHDTPSPSQHSSLRTSSPIVAPQDKVSIPLISLARQLYKTDSGKLSETGTEQSIRTSRQKALRATGEPFRDSIDAEAIVRKPSLALQPLRCNRVTMHPDDMSSGQRSRRRNSQSLQPIRRRSTSLDRELSQDFLRSRDDRRKHNAPATNIEHQLRNSIIGLENLMQEAVQLAKQAADSGHPEEVPAILHGARIALHLGPPSGQGKDKQRRNRHSEYSSAASSGMSGSDSDGQSLSDPNVPQMSSRRRRRIRTDGPASDHNSTLDSPSLVGVSTIPIVIGSSRPGKAIWDEDWPHHRTTIPKPLETRSVDFAYNRSATDSAKVDNDHPLLNQQRPPLLRRVTSMNRQTPSTQTSLAVNRPESEPTTLVAAGDASLSTQPSRDVPPQSTVIPESVANPPITVVPSPLLATTLVLPSPEVDASQTAAASADMPSPLDAGTSNPTDTVLAEVNKGENWGRDKYDEREYVRTDLKGKNHVTLKDGESFSLNHGHRRQPIARNWDPVRKRLVATMACVNTALIGILIGVYAGEVPAIQYTLADLDHQIILGNVYLYIGMAITTFFFWPLPLLHGRKPYTLLSLGIAMPLHIPQAVIVQESRQTRTEYKGYVTGLLLSRALLGLVLGFAHVNFKATLLDLYGSSLQSEFPHGEVVIVDDVRRHGGGMGYWLGIWSFSFIGSLAVGFLIGANVIAALNQSWGFYFCIILLAIVLFLNVLTPETRRSPYRRTMQEVELPNQDISRRVARGEVKMHVSGEGPKWWWEEVFAGVYLTSRMLLQSGFFLMALYMAWIYAQIVLIIVLLGNLLSTEYAWRPEYVAVGVLGVAIGALLGIPNSKANFFSRSRSMPPRTDSMTFQPRFGWSSHLVRRSLFMIALPIVGLAYTLASVGRQVNYIAPIIFAAMIGYISNLAMAECNGIIMETFDTSDLQPGANSRHRLQSLSATTKSKRTSYSSYPRVTAGLCAAQSLGFLLAAAATGVGGAVTRRVGAQRATAITAGILLFLTLLLTVSLFRFRAVQVIPNELFGQYFGSNNAGARRGSVQSDKSWRAIVIGNPSGKSRRMSWLELGSLSRWTEIRRLNRLLNRSTTQALNPGWQ